MTDIWDRLAREVYDFGEEDAKAQGDDSHGPFEQAPPSFQAFCRGMGEHIVKRWLEMRAEADARFKAEGEDVEYPVPANQTRKDVH